MHPMPIAQEVDAGVYCLGQDTVRAWTQSSGTEPGSERIILVVAVRKCGRVWEGYKVRIMRKCKSFGFCRWRIGSLWRGIGRVSFATMLSLSFDDQNFLIDNPYTLF